MDLGVFRIPLHFFVYEPIVVLALLITPAMGSPGHSHFHLVYRYLDSFRPRNLLHLIVSRVSHVNANYSCDQKYVELYRKDRGQGNIAQDRA